jgi:hypothetical protein
MTINVQYVPLEYCAQTWVRIEKYIQEAMKYGYGDYTIDQIRLLINTGQWLLMVAVDEQGEVHGMATSSFLNYPNSRVAFITCISGKLISNQETFKQMSEILKSRGATKIQGMARPAIARLWKRFGFYERTTLVEVKL